MKSILFCLSLFLVSYVHGQTPRPAPSREPKTIYQTENLVIRQISKNVFVHISYLQTMDFGKVACNGMLVRHGNEALVFDTPTSNKSAEELIRYINEILHVKIKAIVPTHFHEDCLGGLAAFHAHAIPSYGQVQTLELTKANNLISPQYGFRDSLRLDVGNTFVAIKYLGEGHTKDNVVAYFPRERVLFGGCLIKELQATKGFLGDANLREWSKTVEQVKRQFPKVQQVIPGHGKPGGPELLDYTISLFKGGA